MAQNSKIVSIAEAIGTYVHDGAVLYMGGFIQQQPFSAAHEIIRQNKRNLTLSGCAGLILADQMIGAGVVTHLITAFTWNPLPAKAHCFIRATKMGSPHKIELEEYSILSLSLAYFAGSLDLPFVATKTVLGSGFDREESGSGAKNRLIFEKSPIDGERVCLVPPIKHDVGIIHVERSDQHGNAQAWGFLGESRYGLQSCKDIIICAEEIVDTDVILRDPNRTIIPGFRVSAVVEEPWGAHPSSLAGYYDMDWPYYAFYEKETRTEKGFQAFLKTWVYGVKDRTEYVALLGDQRLERLRPKPFIADPVLYGKFDRNFGVDYG